MASHGRQPRTQLGHSVPSNSEPTSWVESLIQRVSMCGAGWIAAVKLLPDDSGTGQISAGQPSSPPQKHRSARDHLAYSARAGDFASRHKILEWHLRKIIVKLYVACYRRRTLDPKKITTQRWMRRFSLARLTRVLVLMLGTLTREPGTRERDDRLPRDVRCTKASPAARPHR